VTNAFAELLSDDESVDIAAASTAATSTPTTPVGSCVTMNSGKTSSVEAASNAWVSYIEKYKKSKTEADPRHRAPMLDVMTLEELRAETQTDRYSFVVRRENVEEVKMRPRKTGFSLDEKGVEGFLTFRHTQTGKWPLKMLTVEDYAEGAALMERVVGADRIKKG
jgi:hypothetical protein